MIHLEAFCSCISTRWQRNRMGYTGQNSTASQDTKLSTKPEEQRPRESLERTYALRAWLHCCASPAVLHLIQKLVEAESVPRIDSHLVSGSYCLSIELV